MQNIYIKDLEKVIRHEEMQLALTIDLKNNYKDLTVWVSDVDERTKYIQELNSFRAEYNRLNDAINDKIYSIEQSAFEHRYNL